MRERDQIVNESQNRLTTEAADPSLIRKTKQLLADIREGEWENTETTPIVWAYEQDGSMNPPIVTVNRWSRTPEGWSEANLSGTLADPDNGPTSGNLHSWSASLNKIAEQATDMELDIELSIIAQEIENAAFYAQANELLQSLGRGPLRQQAPNIEQPASNDSASTSITQNALRESLSAPGGENQRVLVVRDARGPRLIEAIILDPEPWQIEEYAGRTGLVSSQMSLSTFASTLWQYPNLHEAMTYATWTRLAEYLQPRLPDLYLDNPTLSGLESTNPVDLPPIIARNRLALLDSFAKPENLQAKIELTEIAMASLYGEPVNEDVFSSASLACANWHTISDHAGIGDLMEAGQTMTGEINSYRKTFAHLTEKGEAIDPGDRFELARLEQECSEIGHLVDMAHLQIERRERQEARAASQDYHDEDEDLSANFGP